MWSEQQKRLLQKLNKAQGKGLKAKNIVLRLFSIAIVTEIK
jgi:hypothetical protein